MKTIKFVSGRIMQLLYPLNENEISFFDVKELYDAAYDEKAKADASLARFKALMEQAEALDLAYRAQLQAKKAPLTARRAA